MTKKSGGKPNIERTLSAADPKLGKVIAAVKERMGELRPPHSKDSSFESLVRAIIYQRISAKAGAAIYVKLQQLTGNRLTAEAIQGLAHDKVRGVGLSNSKASYVYNLAAWFTGNPKVAKSLPGLPDEAVVGALTSIAGVGEWTANVFLIFKLGRLDVMPASDFGIRRGVQLTYGLKSVPPREVVHEKSLRWRPYRSVASMYLWNAIKLGLTSKNLKR